ncbi:MAG TPA: hypothetical protein PKY45_14635 [Deltaproteobacteria bacterium]|nr:hypothetical protein [Deltaproteobacteria bacterium]
MARQDLLSSEDFLLYQQDLLNRLDSHYRDLHKTLSLPSTTIEAEEGVLMRLNSQRAMIKELEIIIALPTDYIPKEKEGQKQQAKKTIGQKMLDIFRASLQKQEDMQQ